MRDTIRGTIQPFDAQQWHIGIVVAQFNKHITDKLLQSALKRAKDYKIPEENITILEVAGSVEIPLVLQHLAKQDKYQALLAIGCIIRGGTPHFDYVCKMITDGILRVQLVNSMPIGFGILTCDNEDQAIARQNIGSEHLDAVLQQARIIV